MQIEGANALVTGGASGLGAATARRLAEAGAQVTIADLNAEKGEALADELGAHVRRLRRHRAGAGRGRGRRRRRATCASRSTAPASAGRATVPASAGRTTSSRSEIIVTVNLIGTFNVLRLAAAAMSPTSPTTAASAA